MQKKGIGITILFPNEIRIFLIESNYLEESIQLLKIVNICKYNSKEILFTKTNIKDNPLEFIEQIDKICLTNRKTVLEDMSEVFIFNIIFLLIGKNTEVINIKQLKEFQELDEQIKNEYIYIMKMIKEKKNIKKEKIQFLMSKKDYEKNTTFEIIYRLLFINLLKDKMLINYQINLLIYFTNTYGIFSTEETLLKLCINQLEKDIKENKNYLQKRNIEEKIEKYNIESNIINAKKIYIEALKDLGFDGITMQNINWLKDI